MNIQKRLFDCGSCHEKHEIEIDLDSLTKGQLAGQEPIISSFLCPNMARMYRVLNFALDLRVNGMKGAPHSNEGAAKISESLLSGFKEEWGERDIKAKVERFIKLDAPLLGVPEEYYNLLQPIISAYCCGYFYPAMTAAGALGERILNRLMLKTRQHFKSSPHYKKIYSKKSSDDWELLVKILRDWDIISEEVGNDFLKLKQYRNDSIHYNDGYDFDGNAYTAVKLLTEIISKQFGYQRKDIFWYFNCPGEIWVKSSAAENPFVIEFVLPQCALLTPLCEPTATPPIWGKGTPLKPLSDEEFIRIRNERKK